MSSILDQPAFPGGQMQELPTPDGKPMYIPNYAGFTKRELLHIVGAVAIYSNDDKMMSLDMAAKKYGKTLEDLMIDSIHAFVSTIENSISKGAKQDDDNEQSNDSDRPSE